MKILNPARLLLIAACITTNAAAHPGHHPASDEPATTSGLTHFLTHIDHVGPVILTLLLTWFMLSRRTRSGTGR